MSTDAVPTGEQHSAEQVWKCEDCGDCTLLTIGPNTDGDLCDWCQNCGCHAAWHHGPACACVSCHLTHHYESPIRSAKPDGAAS